MIALVVVAVVAIAALLILMTGGMQGTSYSLSRDDAAGQAFNVAVDEQARYCRCIMPGASYIIDSTWNPALTNKDVWNPPHATSQSCSDSWIVATCQQQSGTLSATTDKTQHV